MPAPFVSYITFNRLGVTVESLSSLLNSFDDFELHIVDNHSTDGTWKYLQSLRDRRIKSKTQLPVNSGQVYALNFNLRKRKRNQYFITVDSDVVVQTRDWVKRFMKAFKAFPAVGLVSALGTPPPERLPPAAPIFKKDQFCLELDKKLYINDLFRKKFRWKLDETIKDMLNGARPIYCASLLDETLPANHLLNMAWACESIQFYVDNAN